MLLIPSAKEVPHLLCKITNSNFYHNLTFVQHHCEQESTSNAQIEHAVRLMGDTIGDHA